MALLPLVLRKSLRIQSLRISSKCKADLAFQKLTTLMTNPAWNLSFQRCPKIHSSNILSLLQLQIKLLKMKSELALLQLAKLVQLDMVKSWLKDSQVNPLSSKSTFISQRLSKSILTLKILPTKLDCLRFKSNRTTKHKSLNWSTVRLKWTLLSKLIQSWRCCSFCKRKTKFKSIWLLLT